MKVAIPIWNQRISPVFDTARKLLVVTHENGKEKDRMEYDLAEFDFFYRVNRLLVLQVDVLICGAISKPLKDELTTRKIKVISHICGFVEEVFQAFCTDQITEERFIMPGCCGKRQFRYRRRGPNCQQKEQPCESRRKFSRKNNR